MKAVEGKGGLAGLLTTPWRRFNGKGRLPRFGAWPKAEFGSGIDRRKERAPFANAEGRAPDRGVRPCALDVFIQ